MICTIKIVVQLIKDIMIVESNESVSISLSHDYTTAH